jgi:ribosomal protein S18 acetylase RimI-like enzyme
MEITIRRITNDDAAALSAIAKQTFYDTFSGTCTEADMKGFLEEYYSDEQIKKELSNANDFYFFAEVGGIPVGYIRFMEEYRNFSLMAQWQAMELKRIYVLTAYHGMGIAQKLMDFVIDYCIQENYEVLWLGVWENNIRAQKFYEKYGFKNSGHTHYFPIGSTPQTDFWFWKFL